MQIDEYKKMFKAEKSNWWFKGRRILYESLLQRFLKGKNIKILDLGCGTGYNLKVLSKYGSVNGADFSDEAIRFCKKRGFIVDKLNLEKSPIKGKYDLITAFDVLEHIQNDKNLIKKVFKGLNKKGLFVFTVPVFPYLWSKHDEALHHKRRYDKKGLERIIKKSGFDILKSSYTNMFAYPFAFLRKFYAKGSSTASKENRFMNKLLVIPYYIERVLLSVFNLPFGVSLILVAKKE